MNTRADLRSILYRIIIYRPYTTPPGENNIKPDDHKSLTLNSPNIDSHRNERVSQHNVSDTRNGDVLEEDALIVNKTSQWRNYMQCAVAA